MIDKKVYFIFFIIFFFISSCSFYKSSAIWDGGGVTEERITELEVEQRRILNIINIYSSEDFFSSEVPALKPVDISMPVKNLSWFMPSLNLQNFVGHNYLTGIENIFLKKKAGKNKFFLDNAKPHILYLDDSVFYADDTGSIFRISTNGKVIWKKNIYKKVYKRLYKALSLTINKNTIYVADNIGFIYSLNAENGKIIWIKNHGVPIKSYLKIYNQKLFLINQDNRIICFNAKDGSMIWDVKNPKSFIKSQNLLSLAISKKGDLLAINSTGDLIKINANRGNVHWSLNVALSTNSTDAGFFQSSEVIIADEDIIFSTKTSTLSYNLENGYSNWQFDIQSTNNPIIDENNIFIVSDHGFFVNLDRNSGKVLWSTNILKILKERKQRTNITGFVMGSGKIYVTTSNGFIITCSATTGNVESFKKVGDPIAAAPIIINGSLYILTKNFKLLGFN